jgi:hypothetical protein
MQLLDIIVPVVFFSLSVGILCYFVKEKDADYYLILNKKRVDDEESV